MDRVVYDEFSYFAENAAEYQIPFTPPEVRRETVALEDGRSMSSLVWGSASPEVVLVHGGAQNAHTWDTVCLALDTPLIAIDLPGHGHSDGPAEGAANVQRNAADVVAVVDALAPEAQMLVGMSLGGLTSFAIIGDQPDRFGTVLVVDITPGVQSEKAAHIASFVNGPTSFESFDDLLERTMEFNPSRSESSLRRGILHNAEQLDDGSWVWRHAKHRVFGSQDDGEKVARDYTSLWGALEAHEGRFVLARGLREQSVVTNGEVDEIRERRPDAVVENFVEAGHSIQGDMPVELAGLIAAELQRAKDLDF